MLNHVRVTDATSGHPEGVCELWVKGKFEYLTPAECQQVAAQLLAYAPVPPVPTAPPAVESEDAATA